MTSGQSSPSQSAVEDDGDDGAPGLSELNSDSEWIILPILPLFPFPETLLPFPLGTLQTTFRGQSHNFVASFQ